ncbi:MAG: hypothetical protein R3B83_10270 [Nitrospirales bacterium]|nr:hypothetical protein [Nitrospirales bacterium]
MSEEIHRLQTLMNELYGMENIIAKSPEMQSVLQQVSRCKTDTTVYIWRNGNWEGSHCAGDSLQ